MQVSKIGKGKSIVTKYNSKLGGGGGLYLCNDHVISYEVAKKGAWEKDNVDFLANSIIVLSKENHAVLIDIGANQGLISLQVTNKVGSTKDLHCVLVEPHPIYMACSKMNLVHHVDTTFVEKILSPAPNRAKEYLYFSEYSSSGTTRQELLYDNHGKILSPNRIEVETISLKTFFESLLHLHPKSDFYVKSDTDGSDISLLFGLEKYLPRINAFVIEILFYDTDFDYLARVKLVKLFVSYKYLSLDGESRRDVIEMILMTRIHSFSDLLVSR
jgi:FkbM family methyltransferase